MRKRCIVKTLAVTALCACMAGGTITAFAQPPQDLGEMVQMTSQRLTIQEAGTYILTGSMHGTVYVDPGVGDVVLVMDNATIDGGQEPAIMAVSGDAMKIQMMPGTVNRISDSAENTTWQSALYSKVDTAIDGKGQLQINGNSRDGVRIENSTLTFNEGQFLFAAPGNAFATDTQMPGTIQFNGGEFAANVKGDLFAPGLNSVLNGVDIQKTDKTDISEVFGGQKPAAEAGESAEGESQGEMPQAPQGEAPESFGGESSGEMPQTSTGTTTQTQPAGQPSDSFGGQSQGEMPEGMQPGSMNVTSSANQAGEIVEGQTTNSAASLEADYENAITIVLSDDNSSAKITDSGTYVVSGSSDDGSITVKKGTTGVVLVLNDLDLTSTSGAALSVNKEAEVKIIVEGNVTLTDAENPEDENSADADVADAYDGAALKGKANSSIYITGSGTLTINGNAKNGIKMGDDSSLVIDGDLDINITAANDGINSNYDVAILNGDLNIDAADDAIHADHILTIGNEDGSGPDIDITASTEGLEGTVVNIQGGDIDITSSDDAINAANKDAVYEGVLDYSVNVTGGDVTINSTGDGIDSNGNVNLIDGSISIHSAVGGGESGIDYDGDLYVSEDFDLNNGSGVSGPDNMGMMPGMQNNGQMMNPGESFSGQAPQQSMNAGNGFSGQAMNLGGMPNGR